MLPTKARLVPKMCFVFLFFSIAVSFFVKRAISAKHGSGENKQMLGSVAGLFKLRDDHKF